MSRLFGFAVISSAVLLGGCAQGDSLAGRLGLDANDAYQQVGGQEFCGPSSLVMSGLPSAATYYVRPDSLPPVATVPMPKSVNFVADDRRVRVVINEGSGTLCGIWNCGGGIYFSNSYGERHDNTETVAGYYLRWREKGAAEFKNFRVLTVQETDLQPLDNTKTYEVEVYTVDMTGQLSFPVIAEIKPDPSRVDRLRKEMTAFFDDFNLGAGTFDERKWNTGFSLNNGLPFNGSFINTQFHAHSMVSSEGKTYYNDRSQMATRPRAILDLSDGQERRIVFDLDGIGGGRDVWYLDIHPIALNQGRYDVNWKADLGATLLDAPCATMEPAFPGGYFRVSASGASDLEFSVFNAKGQKIAGGNGNGVLAGDTSLPCGSAGRKPKFNFNSNAERGVRAIPNSQRHWELRISKTRQRVYVDGKLIAEEQLSLPFDQAQLSWVVFSYNTEKNGSTEASLVHWDNFGFDGPAPTTVTHNYKLSANGSDRLTSASLKTVKLTIPDSVEGAVSRRLFVTYQGYINQVCRFAQSPSVSINGRSLALPKPEAVVRGFWASQGVPQAQIDLDAAKLATVGSNTPFAVQVDVPEGYLKGGPGASGENTLVFSGDCSLTNVHAELDFPKATAPSYTQPYQIIGNGDPLVGMPTMWAWGPRVMYVGMNPTTLQSLPATTQVKVRADNHVTLNSSGGYLGVERFEVRIDGQLLQTRAVNRGVPAPYSIQDFDLDLTPYRDGLEHALQIVAYSQDGKISYRGNTEAHGGVPLTRTAEPNPPVKFVVQ